MKVYVSAPMSGHANLPVTNQVESGEHRFNRIDDKVSNLLTI